MQDIDAYSTKVYLASSLPKLLLLLIDNLLSELEKRNDYIKLEKLK